MLLMSCWLQEQSTKAGKPYLNNHLRFKILYHQEPTGKLSVLGRVVTVAKSWPAGYYGSRIVGFEVEAFRCAHWRGILPEQP